MDAVRAVPSYNSDPGKEEFRHLLPANNRSAFLKIVHNTKFRIVTKIVIGVTVIKKNFTCVIG